MVQEQSGRSLIYIRKSRGPRTASSWLAVIPSVGLNCRHLEPDQLWCLGIIINTYSGSCCPNCPDHQLDPLGHHAVTCNGGGMSCCTPTGLGMFILSSATEHVWGQLEVGCGLGADKRHSRSADSLVHNWIIGKPAAFDLTITSPPNSSILTEAGTRSGSAGWQLKFGSINFG